MDTLTLGLSKEVAKEGIRVNAVAPGFVETELHDSSGIVDRLGKKTELIGTQLTPETNLGSLAKGLAAALHVCAETQADLSESKT